MGTPYVEKHGAFRDALEAFLRDQCGVNPRIIGKNEYPEGSPLAKIRDVMRQCHGVIVVAYERKFLETGFEKRSSASEKELLARSYTTPWNHIESAMAYTLDLPLYILCQRGLSEEGLIEDKIDWYVYKIEVDPTELGDPDLAQSIRSWVASRVIPKSKRPRFLRSIEGSLKISDMSPKEIIASLGIIFGAFGFGLALAKMFPQLIGL